MAHVGIIASDCVRGHLPEHVLSSKSRDLELTTDIDEVASLVDDLPELFGYSSTALGNYALAF